MPEMREIDNAEVISDFCANKTDWEIDYEKEVYCCTALPGLYIG